MSDERGPDGGAERDQREREREQDGALEHEYREPDIYAGIDDDELDAPAGAVRATEATEAPEPRTRSTPTAPAGRAAGPESLAHGARAARAGSRRAVRNRLIVALALLAVLIVLAILIVPRLLAGGATPGGSWVGSTSTPTGEGPAVSPSAPAEATAPAAPGAGLDLTTASSLTVLVNKRLPLQPQDYAPDDLVAMSEVGVPSLNGGSLRREAALAMRDLAAAAGTEAGLELDMTSGYREYSVQQGLYSRYVDELGQAGADATSARPGFSEHQTGLAADISTVGGSCVLEACYAETDGGRWLAANAWRFGFILRYPNGETATTGYEFEPWHYRYLGVDAARRCHDSGAATYEQFAGSAAAPDYAG